MNHADFSSITLQDTGKKFIQSWVFRNLSFQINRGEKISVTGNNGSGKSTLLQVLSGYVTPSEGQVIWNRTNGVIPTDEIFRMVSLAAPYLELIEPFTLEENIRFYSRNKNLKDGIDTKDVISLAGLGGHERKLVRNFSSGMKQRLKLSLAFLANTPVLLLDEPLSNLDDQGTLWYRSLCDKLEHDRTVVVCSNRTDEETFFCKRNIHLSKSERS